MKSALVCGSQPFSLPPQQFLLLLLLLHPQHLWLGSRRVTAARRAEVDTVVRTVTASRRVARASASAHLVGSNLQGGAGKAAPVCSAAFSSAGKLGCWATSFFFFLFESVGKCDVTVAVTLAEVLPAFGARCSLMNDCVLILRL